LFSLCYGYLPPYPVLWDTVQFSSFPRDGSDGRVEVNAWNYTHRLALYQRILSGTPHCLWNSGHGNPVWGLPLQHGWQEFTGRLCINATSHPSDTALLPACWWGCANYYFSVLPYLGAQQASLVPPIRLAPTPGGDATGQFCDGEAGCQQDVATVAIRHWADFFRTVNSTKDRCMPSSLPDPSSPLMSMLMDRYWSGHTATINATNMCAAHLGSFSATEAQFALGWSNLVKFLGPTRFNVNYSMTTELQNLLPYRLLTASDKPGHINDMDAATNRGIQMVEELATVNKDSGGRFLRLWDEAMCSESARAQARDAIHKGLTDVAVLAKDAIKIMWDLIFSKKNCTKP